MTPRFPIVLPGRLLRAAFGLFACALMILAVISVPATAAARVGLPGATLEQAHDALPSHPALPTAHADGVALDLDDASGDERFSSGTSIGAGASTSSAGLLSLADAPRNEAAARLPERPPRA